MLKKVLRKVLPNPFEKLLKQASMQNKASFLLIWNRGLGDIALGLYAIVLRIKTRIPKAEITFVTREDLIEGFTLLEGIKAFSSKLLKRGKSFDLKEIAKEKGLILEDFDVVISHPDPTYWVSWQLGKLQPKLMWQKEWDALFFEDPLPEKDKCVAIHVNSETVYGYEKNWDDAKWSALFLELEKRGYSCLLFGQKPTRTFSQKNIIDLRGKTSLLQLLSLIKNRCSYFIGPDSGVLSLLYFINTSFTLKVISIWADPKQGILKQKVASPNPLLVHFPLIAKDKNLQTLSINGVLDLL